VGWRTDTGRQTRTRLDPTARDVPADNGTGPTDARKAAVRRFGRSDRSRLTVDDVRAEYERLRAAGVRFTQEPAEMGPVTTAVFDDTCGNLIQIASQY
jgi:hypothetical protein